MRTASRYAVRDTDSCSLEETSPSSRSPGWYSPDTMAIPSLRAIVPCSLRALAGGSGGGDPVMRVIWLGRKRTAILYSECANGYACRRALCDARVPPAMPNNRLSRIARPPRRSDHPRTRAARPPRRSHQLRAAPRQPGFPPAIKKLRQKAAAILLSRPDSLIV